MDIYKIEIYKKGMFEECTPYISQQDTNTFALKFSAPDTAFVGDKIIFDASNQIYTTEKINTFNWMIEDSLYTENTISLNYKAEESGLKKIQLLVETEKDNNFCYSKTITVLPISMKNNTIVNSNNNATNNNANALLVLEPLYFDLNKYTIREDALEIINSNITKLKQNERYTIVISSHCDSRGSFDYNKRLSQKRANAVIAYMIKKGISRSRISSVLSLGESQLFNECADGVNCEESQHQMNRRVEFKFIEGK